jgi:hypothetical protein
VIGHRPRFSLISCFVHLNVLNDHSFKESIGDCDGNVIRLVTRFCPLVPDLVDAADDVNIRAVPIESVVDKILA